MGENELDLSYISQEMQKVLEEDRMMASFVKGAEKELQLMFKNVQEQDSIDSNMAKTMVHTFIYLVLASLKCMYDKKQFILH